MYDVIQYGFPDFHNGNTGKQSLKSQIRVV